MHVSYSESSLAAHKKARSMSGQQKDRSVACLQHGMCDMPLWPYKGPLGWRDKRLHTKVGAGFEAVREPWRLLGDLCKAQLRGGLESAEKLR